MDIITGKSLSRRTVLRGLGATVALPFLDAMAPALKALERTPGGVTRRFQAIYTPNGMAMPYFTPATVGKAFELSPILEPMGAFQDQMQVITGLDASWNYVHAGASGSFLTGTSHGAKNETEVVAEKSIDQILADEFGRSTQLASLELSMDKEANAGQCTAGLSCAYTQTISWRTPTMPLPMENNPRAVFERMFGDSGSADPAVRAARLQEKKSILDSVSDRLSDLNRRLGPTDRVKVGDWTTAIRDVERRIELAEAQSDITPGTTWKEPRGVPVDFEEHLALMFDLQLLAFRSDLTRVMTFMLGREQSTRAYPQVGVSDAHHMLSHHQNVPERVELMSKVNTYHAKLTAGYLANLRATEDGDGSLLDHMTILYGCGMSNSTRHSGIGIPLVLLGGGNGRLNGGRHLEYPAGTSHADLLVTLMDKFDVPVERIGSSTTGLPLETLSDV